MINIRSLIAIFGQLSEISSLTTPSFDTELTTSFISDGVDTKGNFMLALNQSTTSNCSRMSFMEVVPRMKSLRSGLEGFFLIKTSRACNK